MSPTATRPTDPVLADELVATVRAFVIKDVLPVASDYEHADEYPADLVEKMKADRAVRLSRRRKSTAGSASTCSTYARIIEELAAGWMSLSGLLNTHMMRATLLKLHGTDEQRKRLLPRLATGEIRGCLSLSEPDAGSDTRVAAVPGHARRRRVRPRPARRCGSPTASGPASSRWRPRTEKASRASWSRRSRARRSAGSRVSKNIGKLGYKGLETVEMVYDDHRVPADCVLGGDEGLGQGLHHILGAIEVGRINIAARSVGVARAAFEAAIAYAQERETFGKPIAEHQAIQFKLADMATQARRRRACSPSTRPTKQTGRPRRRRGGHGEAVRERGRVRDRDRVPCASTAASATPPSCRSSATSATRRS